MARARSAAGGGRIRIEAELLDVRKDDDAPDLVAYAFGAGGRLLGSAGLSDGKGSLSVPETKEPEAVRVVVGPPIDRDDDGEILQTLMRIGAPETMVRLDELKDALVFPLDRVLWHCWLRFCTVRGKLLKRTLSAGIPIDLPVCGAEIEVYEVDPVTIIWPKIPDLVIDRIRDLIRRPWPPPPPPEERFPYGVPFPPVPPGPGPDPAPFFEGGIGLSRPTAAAQPSFARSFAASPQIREEVMHLLDELRGKEGAELELKEVSGSAAVLAKAAVTEERLFAFDSGEAMTADPGEVTASLRALAEVPELRIAAASGLAPFKSAVLARPELLRPLLCWLWPQAVTMQLVATVTTDDCGRFRAVFYRGCSSDVPDLYFKAYRRIGWWRIPILAPLPVACHTWWDYACGTEVTLWTTSPFAHTCPPCLPVIAPDHWVLPMAVGNTSLASIRGTSVALQPSTNAGNVGLTGGGAPWGGSLRFRIEFDHTLRTDLNVRYYRLRWRKVGSGNPFMPLNADVRRHFAHMVGPFLSISPYLLGPQTVGGTPDLYEIPPALPPIGQWVIADAVEDTTSSLFPSQTFAPPAGAGLYEFELTLFTAAGAAVNANALGIAYRVPTTTDLTATIPTANAAALGLVTAAGRFVMQLHVDNNECTALIDPPVVAGSVSADPCGLLRYGATGDAVTLGYTATHPNGFATYSFGVQKGVTPIPAVAQGGPVGPAPGVHTVATTAGVLLGGCTIAGFAETLSVWAMATDGWSRLAGYDDHKVRAFALAPVGA